MVKAVAPLDRPTRQLWVVFSKAATSVLPSPLKSPTCSVLKTAPATVIWPHLTVVRLLVPLDRPTHSSPEECRPITSSLPSALKSPSERKSQPECDQLVAQLLAVSVVPLDRPTRQVPADWSKTARPLARTVLRVTSLPSPPL